MFSHCEENRGDRIVDILTDEENGFRITVNRLGAELVSLARRNKAGNWIGFLHRDADLTAPTKGWASHATVMGYFLHRLKDGRTLYRGQKIEGGTHSFLRTKMWRRLDQTADEAALRYRITPDDFSRVEYPLKVSLDLTYRMDSDRLAVRFHFRNDEPDLTAHVEFGLHPGFAATSFDSFRFEMPPGRYRRHLSPNNYLSGETEEIEFAGGQMPFAREQLPGSLILELVDVPHPEFRYFDPPGGRKVTLNLAGVPYLTLWSDGGPFLCAEPCWGLTDHHQQRAFEEKEGIQEIPPNGELTAEFVMMIRLTD